MMVGISRISLQKLSFRSKAAEERRTIIVGLKSDNYSREILLRLLTLVVRPRDNVLAIHVQDSDDTFDPNTFHIHEDLCKSKQVLLLAQKQNNEPKPKRVGFFFLFCL